MSKQREKESIKNGATNESQKTMLTDIEKEEMRKKIEEQVILAKAEQEKKEQYKEQ